MSINDLLVQMQKLSRADKLRAMQFLISDLAREEGIIFPTESEGIVSRLRDSHLGAEQLKQLLEEDQQVVNAK